MSFVNYAARELNLKIVYYGPGLSGKTTNIRYLHEKTDPEKKSQLISLATETNQTLFFDMLVPEAGSVQGFKIRFHFYTVPGQVFYESSRKMILKGVDGVVFIADSSVDRMDANVESLENLIQNLKSQGFNLDTLPYVLQLNKRDLPKAVSIDEMKSRLIKKNPEEPVVEAIASKGMGVDETLRETIRQVMDDVKSKSG